MSGNKTIETNDNVYDFIEEFADSEQKREDSRTLIKIFKEVTGFEPTLWSNAMIGFGKFHYKSERSKQEGDWPLLGFSPRKTALSLYIFSGSPNHEYLLTDLGKFTRGKGCIYVKKLSDINRDVLVNLMKFTLEYMKTKYPS